MTVRGFTIIELLVVMSIIGILATLAIPAYQSYRVKAHNSAAVAEVAMIALMEETLYVDASRYASYTVAEKKAFLNKTLTVDGVAYLVPLKHLSQMIDSLVKTNANGQTATVVVRSVGGDVIIAEELERLNGLKKKPLTTALTDADVPASTGAEDLVNWAVW